MKRDNIEALCPTASSSVAESNVEFARAGDGRTYIASSRVGYPFHVGRTLELQGDPEGMTSIYLQSCSGGLFENERVSAQFSAREGALAHIATGASTIVHRMPRGEAKQTVRLRVERDALLEYLPEPMILFSGSRLENRLSIEVADSAVCVAGDAFLLHDPDGGDGVFDWFESTAEVHDDSGLLLARDRQRVTGEVFQKPAPGLLGRWRVVGTLLFVVRGSRIDLLLDAVRQPLTAVPGLYAGASRLPNGCGVWVRMLAEDAVAMRAGWHSVWAAGRMVLTGIAPRARRR